MKTCNNCKKHDIGYHTEDRTCYCTEGNTADHNCCCEDSVIFGHTAREQEDATTCSGFEEAA